jgi:hypothetical protein
VAALVTDSEPSALVTRATAARPNAIIQKLFDGTFTRFYRRESTPELR